MRFSTRLAELVIEPVVSLQAATHWLLGVTEQLALGLLLGWLAARALRKLRLRWTWGIFGIGLALLGGAVAGQMAGPLVIACVAAVRNLRRHERRERIGGPGMAGPGRWRGPIDSARLLGRIAVACWRCRSGRWFTDNALLVGYDRELQAAEVPIQGSSGGAHTLVVGAAGSGKTVTQTWMAVRAIEAGMPAVIVDPKDDPDLARAIREAAQRAGKQLYEWSPEGPCVYNPFAHGSDGEIADKALAGERFTEPHYQRQAQRFLGWEVRALRQARIEISLSSLAEHLDPDRLEVVLRRLPDAQARSGYEYIETLNARQRSDLSGVRDRLAILAESDVGPWLTPGEVDECSFDLLSCLRTGAVALFRLRSDSRPLLMQMLGGAIVLDLLTAASALQGSMVPSIAVIDEFAALGAGHVGGLFGRARGAGMSLVLGTQEISDLQLPARETLLRQVTGNLTTTISHRQVNPESAAWVASLSGTRNTWSTTLSDDGRRTYRPMQAPQIAADRVTALRPGQAVVIVHDGPTRGAQIVEMLSPKRR